MKTTTTFQLVPTDKLISYANNARTHSKEQIKKLRSSMREFGFINPIIIDKNFNVIAGHGRLTAATAGLLRQGINGRKITDLTAYLCVNYDAEMTCYS